MDKILMLNGPNLNLLGSREPSIYGRETLEDIVNTAKNHVQRSGMVFDHLQSNSESVLIEKIHAAPGESVSFIVINPAAFTHYSIAIRDALAAVNIPFIEVHLSNIHKREAFRQHSYFSELAEGVICGLGAQGYQLAITAAIHQIHKVR